MVHRTRFIIIFSVQCGISTESRIKRWAGLTAAMSPVSIELVNKGSEFEREEQEGIRNSENFL